MIAFGSTAMEIPKKQTENQMTDCAYMKHELLSSIRNQADLLKMCFATKSFTLGFPTSLKKPWTTPLKSWERLSSNLNKTLPDMGEDDEDENEEIYK